MDVRDAVEADAEALADLTDAPPAVIRNVVHDRTVRVLTEGGDTDESADATDPAPLGFVSYDVRDGVVHLTLFGGDRDACERLLDEPLRFAECEEMPVEVLVGDDDAEMRAALTATGFENQGAGPRFMGGATERFRYETAA